MTRLDKSPLLKHPALWMAAGAGVLLLGASPQLLAEEPTTLPPVAIRQTTVELPAARVSPKGKIAFSVRATEQELQGEVLLRFEAIIPFAKEAGYTSSARISVNG